MKIIKHFFPLIVVIVFTWACQEQDSLLERSPRIELQFYNQDSLSKIDTLLKYISDSINTLDLMTSQLNNAAIDLVEDIDALTILVEGGDIASQSTLDDLLQSADSIKNISNSYDELDSVLKVIQSSNSSTRSLITSGSVLLKSVTNLNNGRSYESIDSAQSWNLPLDMNANVANFSLELGDSTYYLKVEYDLITDVDEKYYVTRYANNIRVTSEKYGGFNSFDSLIPNCKPQECIDSETIIYLYF